MKTVEKLVRALYSAKSYEEVHELVVNYARLHGAPIDPPLKLKHPRKMYYKETFSDGYGNDSEEYKEVSDVSDAKLYSSEVKGTDKHAPVLDIDLPARLVPSSSPEHYHLYIEQLLSWRKYKKLLKAMSDAGIVESAYVKESINRGATFVRTPNTKKD